MTEESTIIQQLRKHDVEAFKALMVDHSEDMVILAYTLLRDPGRANAAVSEVLRSLWDGNLLEGIDLPLHVFLFSEVQRACAFPLRKQTKRPPLRDQRVAGGPS